MRFQHGAMLSAMNSDVRGSTTPASAGPYATRSGEVVKQPVGFQQKLRATARSAYLSIVDRLAPSPTEPFLRCVYSHFVFDDQVRAFSRILDMLSDLGEFVDTDRAVEMAIGREPIDGKYFHLSFDDGFRHVLRNALPILAERSIPALLFVPSAVIGCGWKTAKTYSLDVTANRAVMEVATLDVLESARAHGFTIGSHTRTHARLSTVVGRKELADEICLSKVELEERLGCECKYMSWPYGTAADVSPDALELIEQAGYSACFSAIRGSINSGRCDLMRIPRHHFEVHWPLGHVSFFCKGNGEP